MPPEYDFGPDEGDDREAPPAPRPADLVTTVCWSPASAQLVTALAKAQAEMQNPTKDAANPHFKSKYADLASVRDAVLPVLGKHGLAVLQLPCETPHGPALVTRLLHESGEWVETTNLLRPFKLDPQGVGSALTYRRRYDLQSIAGVAGEDDDDGNAASGRPTVRHGDPRQADRREGPAPRRQEPRSEPPPVEVVKGDPETDTDAVNDLLVRKGYGWSDLVQTANKRFLASYSIARTRWLEFTPAQRKDLVARLNDLPDKCESAPAEPPGEQAPAGGGADPPPAADQSGETPDAVFALLEQWSKLSGASTTRLMSSVIAEAKASAAHLNQFTAEQLRAAAVYIRGRIAAAREQRKKAA